jgi:hypothetical protein
VYSPAFAKIHTLDNNNKINKTYSAFADSYKKKVPKEATKMLLETNRCRQYFIWTTTEQICTANSLIVETY